MENNSAGNTVSRRRAASGKLPFLMFCDKEILYHGFLCFTTIMVTVTQATVLNFFIIAFFRGYYHQVSLGKKKNSSQFFWRFIFDLFLRSLAKKQKVSSNWNLQFSCMHTIRKVNFLSKNSILTKPHYFHEFFTQIFFNNFSREINVVNS